jgi:hypothetical protein
MKKSFGHIPNFGWQEKYENFQPYKETDVLARLLENVDQNYLQAVFTANFVHIFLENNGLHELIGDHEQYYQFTMAEKMKWYKSIKTIASFLSIMNATGTQLNAFEDIAKTTKQTAENNVHTKSPFENITDMFRNPDMRKKMKDAIPSADVMTQLIQNSGSLLECISSGSAENVVFPEEIILDEATILIHQARMKMLAEEKDAAAEEPSSSEPSTDTSIELPKKIQEECMQEEQQKASALLKDVFASMSGKSNNPKETIKNLSKMLSKFTKNEEDMNQLFSSVNTALDQKDIGGLDIASLTKKLRGQMGGAGRGSKDTEDFLFSVPQKPRTVGMSIEELPDEVSREVKLTKPALQEPESVTDDVKSENPFAESGLSMFQQMVDERMKGNSQTAFGGTNSMPFPDFSQLASMMIGMQNNNQNSTEAAKDQNPEQVD